MDDRTPELIAAEVTFANAEKAVQKNRAEYAESKTRLTNEYFVLVSARADARRALNLMRGSSVVSKSAAKKAAAQEKEVSDAGQRAAELAKKQNEMAILNWEKAVPGAKWVTGCVRKPGEIPKYDTLPGKKMGGDF